MDKKMMLLAFLFLIVISGCAGKECARNVDPLSDDGYEEMREVYDPIEPINRVFYHINDFVYVWILDPVDRVYVKLPEDLRKGVRNFFHNASLPVRFVGAAMQGKAEAGNVAGEFVVNTLLGFGGIADWTKYQYSDEEDIGQGLAVWGFSEGCYLILPLFGPTTLRDAVGEVGSFALSPTVLMDTIANVGYCSVETIDKWNASSESYFSIKEKAISDPYLALKRAYVDRRRDRISR